VCSIQIASIRMTATNVTRLTAADFTAR